jgi:hypothetical protein
MLPISRLEPSGIAFAALASNRVLNEPARRLPEMPRIFVMGEIR